MVANERRAANNCSRPDRRPGTNPICESISVARSTRSQSEPKRSVAPAIQARIEDDDLAKSDDDVIRARMRSVAVDALAVARGDSQAGPPTPHPRGQLWSSELARSRLKFGSFSVGHFRT